VWLEFPPPVSLVFFLSEGLSTGSSPFAVFLASIPVAHGPIIEVFTVGQLV